MVKEYLYSIYDGIKIRVNNLAIKLDAIRENQDEILAIKKQVDSAIDENKKVAEAVKNTVDDIGTYSSDEVRAIDSIDGIKEFAAKLEESKGLAEGTIDQFNKHKQSITDLAKSAEETASKIDETEKAIGELRRLQQDVEKLKADADATVQEETLEEKEQKADQMADSDPEKVEQECPNKKVCKLETVEITDKEGRHLSYSVKPDDPQNSQSADEDEKQPPPPKNLYVISGEKKGFDEAITIKVAGQCKSNNACPSVSMAGGSVNEEATHSLNEIKLKSEKVIPDKSWADFLRKILVPDMNQLAKPVQYKVKAHDCDNENKVVDLQVIAFPPAGWKGDATFKFAEKSDEEKKKIKKSNEGKGFLDAEPLGEWTIGGSMSAYLDNEKFDYTPPQTLFDTLQSCMNRITPFFSEIESDYVDVKIGWPNLTFGGKVDLAENPNNHQLSYDGEITISAQPLLNVTLDVDIKAIILRLLGQYKIFSDFLMEIMEKAEEGVKLKYLETSAKIDLKLVTTSEIKGDLEWLRKPSDGKWSVNSEKSTISGSMGIEVFGSVHAEAKTFMVRAAAGAAIAMKSADGKEQSKFTLFWAALEGMENPSLERQMSFNGLGIYYSYFAELGTDGTKAGKAVKEVVQRVARRGSDEQADDNKEQSENLAEAGDKDEMKELCVLMKEWNSKNESLQMGKDSL